MPRMIRAAVVVSFVGVIATAVSASDRVAVYGKIDRVEVAPSPDAPETIQLFGVFSVGVPKNITDYQPAKRGYLYYKLPADKQTARREWADLKQVAGTNQIVAFGLRYESTPTLRPEAEKPSNPDPYTLNAGVTKVSDRTDYAPIKSIIEFKRP